MGISYRSRVAIASALILLFSSSVPSYALDYSLNGEWRFLPVRQADLRSGEDERAKTYSAPELNESGWEPISVPGYWNQPPGNWPWSSPSHTGGPYPDLNGEGWYRYRFTIPENLFPTASGPEDFHASLRFESVSAQASVWLNGTFVGRHLGAFGPFELDVTKALLRGETNVLAIRVRDKTVFQRNGEAESNSKSTVPLGFDPEVGGIRGKVSIRVTPRERILDIGVVSDPTSATVEIEFSAPAIGHSTLTLDLIEKETGKRIEQAVGPPQITVPVTTSKLVLALGDFKPETLPKPWSPESPHLYRLTAKLTNAVGALDVLETDFGFRSFEVRNGKFFLNGRPYFLLGAGSPPHYELPGEGIVRSHLTFLKEAGVRIVRFAYEPPTREWLEVCDELGLLAWVEGALCAEGDPYDLTNSSLIRVASEEMQALARAYRNHPSLVIWAMGSGNSWVLPEEATRQAAARSLRSMAEEVARLDPDAIVLPESQSRGLIPSVIEDWPSGIGWYQGKDEDWRPFLRKFASFITSSTIPWVCSALETGYSTNGQGRVVLDPRERAASRMRIGESGEDRDRLLFTQSKRIRKLIEIARAERNPSRNRIAGIFPFTSANWFFYPLSEGLIRPKPILSAIREAYQPVILSIELPKAHFYAGELLETTVTVVHDSPDGQTLKDLNLILETFMEKDEPGSQTQREIREISSYTSLPLSMVVVLPEEVPLLRRVQIRARLFHGEEEIASNVSEILVAPLSWSRPRSEALSQKVVVYDPLGRMKPYFEKFSLQFDSLNAYEILDRKTGLIVGPGGYDDRLHRAWPILERWVESGGRMVVLDQTKTPNRWFFSGPYPPGYRVVTSPPGWPTGMDRVEVPMEEHPMFEQIRSKSLEDWGKDRVVARSILEPVRPLGDEAGRALVHAAIEGETAEWGLVTVERRFSEGTVLYTQLELAKKAPSDPIAGKILSNLIDWAADSLAPVVFEDGSDAPAFSAPLVGGANREIAALSAGTSETDPIRALVAPDGPWEATRCCGIDAETKNGVIPLSHEYGSEKRVYYDIDDRFWYDEPGDAEVTVLVNCLSPAKIRLDYDSAAKQEVEHLQEYRQSNVVDILEVGIWKEVVFSAPEAAFGNHQNHGADFRLTTVEGEVVYGPITVRRVGP